jgi:hypothetical protein
VISPLAPLDQHNAEPPRVRFVTLSWIRLEERDVGFPTAVVNEDALQPFDTCLKV